MTASENKTRLPGSPQKKRKISAWAVVPKKKWELGTSLVYLQHINNLAHGVFLNEKGAKDFCARISPGVPSKVIKVEILIPG